MSKVYECTQMRCDMRSITPNVRNSPKEPILLDCAPELKDGIAAGGRRQVGMIT